MITYQERYVGIMINLQWTFHISLTSSIAHLRVVQSWSLSNYTGIRIFCHMHLANVRIWMESLYHNIWNCRIIIVIFFPMMEIQSAAKDISYSIAFHVMYEIVNRNKKPSTQTNYHWWVSPIWSFNLGISIWT